MEKKVSYENIRNVSKLAKDGTINELSSKVSVAEKKVSDILKKLNELEEKQRAKRAEAEKAAAAEAEALKAAQQAEAEKAEKAEKVQKAEPEKAEAEKAQKAETQNVVKAEQPVNQEKADKTEKTETVEKTEKTETVENVVKADRVEKAEKAKPAAPSSEKPAANSNANSNANAAEKKPAPVKSSANNAPRRQDTYDNSRRQQSAPSQGRNQNQNKTFINRDSRPPRAGQQPRTAQSVRPAQNRTGTGAQQRPNNKMAIPVAPAASANAKKNFGPDKKKGFEKTYVEKEKRTYSKRALQKQQGATIEDFDENKSGYRKLRLKKDKRQKSSQTIVIEHAVVTTNDIPLKTLSEKLGISAVEITKRLFKNGVMKTVNESVDYDTAAYIAAELGIELEYKPEKTAEEVLFEKQADTVEEIESLVPRPPVVTVMGHVDHGKTSLLDYIRSAHIAAGEAGGITQHIGAYTVNVNGKGITFIDTPGHEAFTAMRARGAQVTDIVILVVAADDGVMPQTVEAINHAKAAGVDIIVAINKIDKIGADPEKVKRELTNYDLLAEEWGGKIPMCPISCKTGEGIDNLLETVILTAELKELLANPAREARGTVIEARLDKGKGPVATVLIQNGTLHTGDNLISGTVAGKVRAMIDDKGKTVKEAGPSMAVNVLGLDAVPESGDAIFAVSQELMKQVMDERKRKESIARVNATPGKDIEALFGSLADGEKKTLNLIIKCDVQGSVEAIKQSVLKLVNDEVNIKVIHGAAGAINESDIMLAESAKAIVVGFNVRPDAKAKALAERSKVDVRMYRVIYDLLDDIEATCKGMRAPKYQEIMLGKCEVRQTFKITGVGNIAGCYVLDGKIVRGGKLRIYRDDVLVVEGGVKQLKRFKDDVKEVAQGFECGCAIEGFNDIKIGDIIECYLIEEIAQK